MQGSHARALRGIRLLRDEGVSVQINSTIAKHNVAELPRMLDLALSIGADALHLFMLVPVGCGLEIAPAQMLPADEYERVLHWFDEQAKTCPIDLKATCAPHYYRIRAQRLEEARRQRRLTARRSSRQARAPRRRRSLLHGSGGHGQHLSAMTRGCLAGTSVCFISNDGRGLSVRLPAGQRRRHARRSAFADIWNASPVFERAAQSRGATKASAASAATRRSAAAAARARTLPPATSCRRSRSACISRKAERPGRGRTLGKPGCHQAAAGLNRTASGFGLQAAGLVGFRP